MIFAVLERWLLQLRETDSSFVFIIIIIIIIILLLLLLLSVVSETAAAKSFACTECVVGCSC